MTFLVQSETNDQAQLSQKDFTWNISSEQRKLLIKDAAEVMDIEPPKRRNDFSIPGDVNLVEKCLLQAQSVANVAIALSQVIAQQRLEGRNESERIEAQLATSVEVNAVIRAARRANLYGFKTDSENIHFLTESSFDALVRVKQVHPIKPKLFQAKKHQNYLQNQYPAKWDWNEREKLEKGEHIKKQKEKSFIKKNTPKPKTQKLFSNRQFRLIYSQYRLIVKIWALKHALPQLKLINGNLLIKQGLCAIYSLQGHPQSLNNTKELYILKDLEEVSYPTFLVKKLSGKFRRIIFCKTVNKNLQTQHFKIEGITDARSALLLQGFTITWDFQSAQCHGIVFKELQNCLAFGFGGVIYSYTTMPFGIGTAPRLYTKIMFPVLATLRSKEVCTTAYLGDGIAQLQTKQEAIQGRKMIGNLFLRPRAKHKLRKISLTHDTIRHISGNRMRFSQYCCFSNLEDDKKKIQASVGCWIVVYQQSNKTARQLASISSLLHATHFVNPLALIKTRKMLQIKDRILIISNCFLNSNIAQYEYPEINPTSDMLKLSSTEDCIQTLPIQSPIKRPTCVSNSIVNTRVQKILNYLSAIQGSLTYASLEKSTWTQHKAVLLFVEFFHKYGASGDYVAFARSTQSLIFSMKTGIRFGSDEIISRDLKEVQKIYPPTPYKRTYQDPEPFFVRTKTQFTISTPVSIVHSDCRPVVSPLATLQQC
ncbi:MAG: hypothetical protein EZS28_011792 [Streblomastix strix]|uniref:Reverse transcriptase domain-containing protein n=1 Tax=Streblomastix strix TaxID=222440 RepID=A0A5J4WCQ9_9EUKA|nr:MAG: hypothetical protein EZS28_011792 [Streblomastix strix]